MRLFSAIVLLCAVSGVTPQPSSFKVGLNFTSTTKATSHTTADAPDMSGAVGPDHVVEFVNGDFRAYDKRSGRLLLEQTADAFWDTANGTPGKNKNNFDPRMVYASRAKRWYASAQRPSTKGDMVITLARSNGPDPTKGWKGVEMLIDAAQTPDNWGDFDQLGFNAEHLGISINQFRMAADKRPRPSGLALYAVEREDFDKDPPVLTVDRHMNIEESRWAVAPAIDQAGESRSITFIGMSRIRSEEKDLFVRLELVPKGDGGALERRATHIGEETPQAAKKTGIPALTVDQPGTGKSFTQTQQPATVHRVKGDLWLVQSVQHPTDATRTAVRWIRFRADDNTIAGEGILSDPSLSFLQPSIAVDTAGNVVIGTNGTSKEQFLSGYVITGRVRGDTVTFDPSFTLVKAGAGVHAKNNRWGDYTTTLADPSMPGRFWTFLVYADANGDWASQITEIILPAK